MTTERNTRGELWRLMDRAERAIDSSASFFVTCSFACMATVMVAWSLWDRIPADLLVPASLLRCVLSATGLAAGLFAWDLTKGKRREVLTALNAMVQTCIFSMALTGLVLAFYLR